MLESTVFKVAIVIITTFLVIGLLKKAIKGAIIVISIFIMILFGYNFIVLNQSPTTTAENLKNDTIYIKEVSLYTIDIQNDLNNITAILSEKYENTERDLNYYIDDLKAIKIAIEDLNHSKNLEKLDEKYCGTLDNIISASENIDNNKKVIETLNTLSRSIKETSDKIKEIEE